MPSTNTLLTISMITREALRVLKNQLKFTGLVNRSFDGKFGVEGAKIGTVVNVRVPPRYIGRSGQALQLENATETSKPVRLTTQFGVDIQFSSADLALSIDDFSKRFLNPAVATIANKVDFDGLQLAKKVFNSVGTPGVTPADNSVYLGAGVKLDNAATPVDGRRYVVMNPQAQATLLYANQALFNPASQISSNFKRGQIGGSMLGFDGWYMDQNVYRHTVGTYAGVPTVSAVAGQTGASIDTIGWTATSLKEGDVFTIAGVNSVNPQNRQDSGVLQQFVALADSGTSSTAITIPISPSIIPSGQFQTVSAAPAANAPITMVGASATTYPQNLACHEDAFVLATADLPLPRGVDMASRMSDEDTGISIRLVRAYDINSDQFPCRLDILYGWSELYTETACRIWG